MGGPLAGELSGLELCESTAQLSYILFSCQQLPPWYPFFQEHAGQGSKLGWKELGCQRQAYLVQVLRGAAHTAHSLSV